MKPWYRRVLPLLAFAGSLAFSTQALAAGTWETPKVIQEFIDYGDMVEIRASGNWIDPASCGNAFGARVNDPVRVDGFRKTLLAAFLSGKPVKIKVDNVVCHDGYPTFYAISVE